MFELLDQSKELENYISRLTKVSMELDIEQYRKDEYLVYFLRSISNFICK